MAAPAQLLSRWHQHIDGLKQSTQEFYTLVEVAVWKREVPGLQFSRVEHREGTLLSAKREYLRISWKILFFDICGAPFGSGFFVSSRLFVRATLIDRTFGPTSFVKALCDPFTFYKQDTAMMYQQLVHGGVLEVIDNLTSGQHLPRIADTERKPVMREFYHQKG